MDAQPQVGEPRHGNDIPAGYRLQNGQLVPAEQPAITRIMQAPPRRDRRWWAIAGVAVAMVLVIAALAAARPGPKLPAQQRAFLKAVTDAQERVREGNAVTLVSARTERAHEFCRLLGRSRSVTNWRGTIHDIDTAGDDDGVITVSIGEHTDLRTGGGFLGDPRTRLRPGTEVFESVARLHNGDDVVFSGTFVRAPGTCIKETSLLARNGILSPDFEFVFRSVGAE